MRKHLGMISLAGAVVVILLASTVAFTVDESRDIVLIKTFGKTTKIYDGSKDPGLKSKWPWPVERLERYDSRQLVFEDAADELQTRDNQNIVVTMYCLWRIADANLFNRAIGDADAGRERVRTLLRTSKSDVLKKYDMSDLVNADPDKMKLAEIESRIHAQLAPAAMEGYGIQVAMVGIKHLGLPESATREVIAGMKAERQKYIQDIESRGRAEAEAITEKAKSASEEILAFANTVTAQIRAEGDTAAAEQLRKFSQNPELSVFLRWLDSLEIQLKTRSVLVLDPSVLPGLEFFRSGAGSDVVLPKSAADEAGDAAARK